MKFSHRPTYFPRTISIRFLLAHGKSMESTGSGRTGVSILRSPIPQKPGRIGKFSSTSGGSSGPSTKALARKAARENFEKSKAG